MIIIAAIALVAAGATVGAVYASGNFDFAEPAESTQGKYVFCYFTGNEPENERIHLAVSEDGYNFRALNNNEPVIEQKLGKQCVRDPYLFRGNDGCFYIIGTDMKCEEGWTSNHALVSWKSYDLINWTDETILDVRDFGGEFANTNRAWAPQAIWDDEAGKYMIYYAVSTEENDCAAIYYSYTDDFKAMTKPQLLYAREGIQTIDGDIVYNSANKKYYLYFKHDEDCTIAYVTSDKLTGPYSDEPVIVSHASSGVEGCQMYNITGTDQWVMMMDEYGKNRFDMEQTSDFENFKKVKRKNFSLKLNQRHGSVIAVSDQEYEALIKAYE
ncbi:MAG: glycoside hydrolase family 43 protein [Eubacterium sp.]